MEVAQGSARSLKNILVIGEAGFIGCNFVRMMLNKYSHIKITSYDNLTYAGSLKNLHDVMDNPRNVFIQGDIGDCQLVTKALREHAIVHFAAERHMILFFERSGRST